MKMFLTLAAVIIGLAIIVGVGRSVVDLTRFGFREPDPPANYVIKIHRAAVKNYHDFRVALHQAAWRRAMRERKDVGGADNEIPNDPNDDPPLAEIDPTPNSGTLELSSKSNWGARVTQRAGFNSLEALNKVLAQLTPTPSPTPPEGQ